MYMPEMGMLPPIHQEGEEKEQALEAVVADQLKRRRIHLPPASNEEQRKRIMEVLARIQSYFGSSIEDLIQVERVRLPAGATVVGGTSTVSHPLLDSLATVKQSGHEGTHSNMRYAPLRAD